MRVSKLGSLVILALLSSCGPTGDGNPDTSSVGIETHDREAPSADPGAPSDRASNTAAPSGAADVDRGVPRDIVDAPKLVGFAGSRFIVFDSEERTVVFDRDTEHAFGVFGHALTETTGVSDAWQQLMLAPAGVPTSVITSVDGGVLLVRTAVGVQAVDLTNHGALLTGWRGDATGASLAPDGSAFVVWNADFVDVVRTKDGAHAKYAARVTADAPPVVGWSDNGSNAVATITDPDGARIVDPSSFRTAHVSMSDAHVSSSKDGASFVVWRHGDATSPGAVEVWQLGDAKPRARITSATVGQVTLDGPHASHVAWSEYNGEYNTKTFFHVLDTTSGVHVRFAATGDCAIAEERLVGFEDGALTSDAECSPGCPSLSSQAQFIAYDITTGARVKSWKGELFPPFNDDFAKRTARVETLATRLGVAARTESSNLPMIHHPKDASVLVVTHTGARLVNDETGALATELDASSGFDVEAMHFTPDGAFVIGTDGESSPAVVWRASDGKRVWSWR